MCLSTTSMVPKLASLTHSFIVKVAAQLVTSVHSHMWELDNRSRFDAVCPTCVERGMHTALLAMAQCIYLGSWRNENFFLRSLESEFHRACRMKVWRLPELK